MVHENRSPEDLFNKAVEITDPAARAAYLDDACKGNEKLRAEVESLLGAHEQAGDFLQEPGSGAVTLDSPPRIDGPGTTIGRYVLLELIGEGGMGLVYLAEQKEPVRRKVAFKIVKPGMDSKQVIARFEAERQALALLDHPNIAHVFDASCTETGRPYFVMEHVKGMSITRYCDEHKLTIEQRLRLFEQVCEAVQHAHQKGIIHRDLKPSNILVTMQGDKPVPKIIDFGIAKATTQSLTDATMFTYQGQFLGTPEYMSPEQADMSTQDIDTRSDIYSLGVVLYELLAGVLPFESESFTKIGLAEIQRTIREVEPASPSIRLTQMGDKAKRIAESRGTQVVPLARRLHRELEWIPLKAMRKDRCRRYKSASDMADDIRNYLNGNPLLAGPETAIYRVQKFVRKHAGSVATAALIAVTIILGLVASTAMYFKAEKAHQKEVVARVQETAARVEAQEAQNVAQEQRGIADEQRGRAERKAEEYRRALYGNSIVLADACYREHDIGRMRGLLNSCPTDLRGWEWYRLNYISDQSVMTLRGHRGRVDSVVVSPDGSRIVSGSWEDGTVKIWDAAAGKELMTLTTGDSQVHCVTFSPDGKRIAAGTGSHIVVWNAEDGSKSTRLDASHGSWVECVAFSPDGKCIASSYYEDPVIRVQDVTSGTEVMALRGHEGTVDCIEFNPDGKRLVSQGSDRTVRVWDTATAREVMRFPGSANWSNSSVSFSADGRLIAFCAGNAVKIWDAESGAEVRELRGHTDSVVSVDFSPDDRFIVSSSSDNTLRIWDTASGDQLKVLHGHLSRAGAAVFSPDGKRIISAGDQTIKVWDPEGVDDVLTLGQHRDRVTSVAFSPDGRRIASGSRDKTVKVWDAETGVELMTLLGGQWHPGCVVFSPDGKYIAAADRHIMMWNAETGAELPPLRGHELQVHSIAFSPDGRQIVSGGRDETVRLWDVASGKQLMTLGTHRTIVVSVTFSPDGRRIVSTSYDGAVRIWDATTGAELMTMGEPSYADCSAMSVAFSPDGKRIALGGRSIRIRDVTSGEKLLTLTSLGVPAVFSPDGKRLISAGDRAIQVWDTITGGQLLTLRGHAAGTGLAVSPDGNTIAAGAANQVMVWKSRAPTDGRSSRLTANAAKKWVDGAYRECGYYYEVIERLRADKTLDAPVRKISLQIANARMGEDVSKLADAIWELDRATSSDLDAYKDVLRRAEAANRVHPDDWFILNVLGVAQHRVGMYEEATVTLNRSAEMRAEAHLEPDFMNLASTAMASYELGRREGAYAALAQLRDLVREVWLDQSEKAKASLFRVEKLFARNNDKLRVVWDRIEAEKYDEAAQMVEELREQRDTDVAGLRGALRYLTEAYCRRDDYERALRMDPNCVQALRGMARWRFMTSDTKSRDGAQAVKLVERLCELTSWKDHKDISTLAAQYSQIGDFASAVKWQKRAIELLTDGERVEWQRVYEAWLRLYESGKTHYESLSSGQLLGWWKLDELRDGSATDSSGNDIEGKMAGDASIISDPNRGNVLALNGNGYINCGSSPTLDAVGSITIAAWVKSSASDESLRTVVRKKNAWDLGGVRGNAFGFVCHWTDTSNTDPGSFSLSDGNVSVSTGTNDGKWHHIVGVYDTRAICLYVDGRLSARTVEDEDNINVDNEPLYIGGSPEAKGSGWQGLLDDVRIYSYALSAEEVKMLYEGKEPPRQKRSE